MPDVQHLRLLDFLCRRFVTSLQHLRMRRPFLQKANLFSSFHSVPKQWITGTNCRRLHLWQKISVEAGCLHFDIIIGGSKWGRGVPGTPPRGSKFFYFHAVFGKKMKNNSTLGSWRTPLGKSWIRHWLCSIKIVHLEKSCFPSWLLFPIFIESPQFFVNSGGLSASILVGICNSFFVP